MSVFNLIPSDSRLATFPIGRRNLWKFYEEARAHFWQPGEITFAHDKKGYCTKLTSDEQHFVKYVLAFFAASDALVVDNIVQRFREDVPIFEAKVFYDFQIMMENIHNETYSMQITEIIPDEAERNALLTSAESDAVIKKMTEWMAAITTSTASFAERLLRMIFVEGLFFKGGFVAINWFKIRGLMPGLSQSNELIMIDEGLHTEFAIYLYCMILPEHRLTAEAVKNITVNATDITKEFMKVALPIKMNNMNYELMAKHMEYSADNLLTYIGHEKLFNTPCQFDFDIQTNMHNHINFFENRSTTYTMLKTVSHVNNDSYKYFTDDF